MKKVKLTLDQWKQLSNKLGLDVDVVDEAQSDVDVEVISGEVLSELTPDPIIDEETIAKRVKAENGKLFGTIRSALGSTFGVKTSDLEGLEPKEIAEKIKETYATRYTHTEKELREQLEDVTNQLNAKEEEYNTKYTSLENEWKTKFQERDVKEGLIKVFNNIPRKGGDVMKQAQLALSEWKSRYDIKINPLNGQIDIYEKGTETLAMDGKNPLKVDALAKQFVTDLGLDVSDTSHINPEDVKKTGGNGESFDKGVFKGSGVPANNVAIASNFASLVADVAADSE